MEKLKLTKSEKRVFRLLASGFTGIPSDIPYDRYILAVRSLKDKGLVYCSFLTDDTLWVIRITEKGRFYIFENPNLKNPVDWNKIAALAAIVSAILALVTILVGCTFLMNYES